MGYACPACGAPQADGEHLANHLAFTALLHADEHEDWLDAHVPDWADRDPSGLAPAVTDLAAETDYPAVFEEAVGHDHGGGREGHRARGAPDRGPVDGVTREALREARAMTERMRGGAGDADDAEE